MRVLHLTVKKRWFDLLISGRKKEEYREIKPYWVRRLIFVRLEEGTYDFSEELRRAHEYNSPLPVIMAYYNAKYRVFDSVVFKNGYGKDCPTVTFEFLGIDIGHGTPLFGAPGHPVFRIALGTEISRQNCE